VTQKSDLYNITHEKKQYDLSCSSTSLITGMSSLHSAKVRLLLFLLSTFALSSANKQGIYATFTKGKAVASSHTSLQQCSQIQCVRKCFKEGKEGACNVAGYNKATKVCYLSTDSEDEIVDVADDFSGVFIVPQPTQGNLN